MRLGSVMLVAFHHELRQRHARLKLNPVDRRHRSPCGYASESLERQRALRLRHKQASALYSGPGGISAARCICGRRGYDRLPQLFWPRQCGL